ncbi:exosortase-associated protein EpsI, B-type [Aquabacterium sp.]|uniref:exosortase-associated protein EpsI, B-type n=1 Tax=Aquabacterium sp. TaxID=1872578 RepID=UPI0027BA80CF|nr:exosortase-associated protein EpsI, B-type [Aquabacterium sp.]
MATMLLAAVLMASSFGLAEWLTPRRVMANEMPVMDLAHIVPESFGGWRVDPSVVPVLPDPTVTEKLDSLYSETLNRTYIRDDGSRVMLSIAYGKNQNSASTAAHRPEFCYSAQGFVVKQSVTDRIQVMDQDLQVVRLLATAGQRREPITYWVTLGQSASIPGISRKMAQMKYGLQGWIMDGMLMRVSSLVPGLDAADQDAAKTLHTQFINDLAKAMPAADRSRFFGSREKD